jgi:hypothetical protein
LLYTELEDGSVVSSGCSNGRCCRVRCLSWLLSGTQHSPVSWVAAMTSCAQHHGMAGSESWFSAPRMSSVNLIRCVCARSFRAAHRSSQNHLYLH